MTEDKDKKEYEVSFLVKSEEQSQSVVKVLHRYGAEITSEGQLSKARLAYPIKKETLAYFGYLWFMSEPSAIPQIESDLRLSKDILRYIIVTPPVKKTLRERQEAQESEKPAPPAPAPVSVEPRKELTNEDLEKKLEEILQ